MNIRAQTDTVAGELKRLRLLARGLVQGVGFRPHVFRTATTLGLSGWVRNDGLGVTLEVEGTRAEEFSRQLRDSLPPLARIDHLESAEIAVRGETGFQIRRSEEGEIGASIPADMALCKHCLQELFDPGNRRYLHPFIACCDCGPRYTMAQRLPYVRRTTTMSAFPMCCDCSREYRDPMSRRFHAEPIACHHCGPTLSRPAKRIAEALLGDQIVALKGVGGYHLVCNAHSDTAVRTLRERKRRDARPFAVMMLNAASAKQQVQCSPAAVASLESPQRPVVVLDRSAAYDLPEAIAPDIATLGVMLPYTAIHYLLFHELLGRPAGHAWLDAPCSIALVMTSANLSGEPMLADDDAAAETLAEIADLLVSHTRRISHACDDSVLRVTENDVALIRRSRGHAPNAVALPAPAKPVLALGAHLKNTVCALRGEEAWMSSHIGDLDSAAMHKLLSRSADELLDWLKIQPEAIACDLHPDYASTRLAQSLSEALDVPLLPVQHHHAHIASIAVASGHDGPVLGLALDGHGIGSDGSSWGGELLAVHGHNVNRIGHLRPLPLPGGDRAAREPWRLALAVAAELGEGTLMRERLQEPLADAVLQLAGTAACPRTTAAGRYFDAAAALLGICLHAPYEAAAPMQLEARCRTPEGDGGLYAIRGGELDLHDLLRALLHCQDAEAGAALFHGTLIDALCDWVEQAVDATGVQTIALGGGCFLNAFLAQGLPAQLRARGFEVLTGAGVVPPGDGGISLGQAWIASQQLSNGAASAAATGGWR